MRSCPKGPLAKACATVHKGLAKWAVSGDLGGSIPPPKWRCLGLAPVGRPSGLGGAGPGVWAGPFLFCRRRRYAMRGRHSGVCALTRAQSRLLWPPAPRVAQRDEKPPRGTFCPKYFAVPLAPPAAFGPPLSLSERRRWVESGPFAAEASLSLFLPQRLTLFFLSLLLLLLSC